MSHSSPRPSPPSSPPLALSHLDDQGRARMVDIGAKPATERLARAEAWVRLGPELAARLAATGAVDKGDVLATARLAGIMAAKRTAELIPLCHQIPLDVVEINGELGPEALRLEATVGCHHGTGVEMEALTAVSVAALTVYDMCKAATKGIVIEGLRLLEKQGGRSGTWRADAAPGSRTP